MPFYKCLHLCSCFKFVKSNNYNVSNYSILYVSEVSGAPISRSKCVFNSTQNQSPKGQTQSGAHNWGRRYGMYRLDSLITASLFVLRFTLRLFFLVFFRHPRSVVHWPLHFHALIQAPGTMNCKST
jgi:hypothetical protein